MSSVTSEKSTVQAISAGKGIIVLAAVTASLTILLVASAVMPEALVAFFGFTTANATAAATAILAGMDVATAVSLFGGATVIGGAALAMLRRAIGKKALVK
ncbi:ABC-type polysaccharide/polyol phosphate export permease [Arthrobacter sp. JUb119]|uniref:hypothetical protein n=1 Tax=Micrococcaceae TaxID=1268 RepID=UPI000CFDC93B|nr:hypothetical protein [Arthrobacter sp. MYb222]MCS3493849.1 ABC-type polysaccharide/polyol phosphate export permease [Arthrobacter sp. JUb119]PQZ89805.1 hypothetical protein CQ016_02800 [Arthrobacter sp. MYb222]